MPTLLENKGVFSPVINDSKILPRNSSGIPLPVSDMIILQNEYPSISIRFILKITFPFGDVYLNALDNKLRIAELIFSTSIHSKSGSFSDSTVKLILLFLPVHEKNRLSALPIPLYRLSKFGV